MSITLDDSSSASHPGGIEISPEKYLKYQGIKGLKYAYYNFLFNRVPYDELESWMGENNFLYYWINAVEHFKHGCLNPAKIIDINTSLIATYTNLSKDGGAATPVIKITQEKLYLIKGKKLDNNTILPTIALYSENKANPNARFWGDFFPLSPHCFSDDFQACELLENRLEENSWKCLNEGLKQIEKPYKEGLYFVSLDASITDW